MRRDGQLASPGRTFAATRDWAGVAELAEAQYGVVSLSQLVALGGRPSTVRGWVARRQLVPLHTEVFAVGHRSLRVEGHYLAAVLACGPGAALSHQSAAAHLGFRRSAASVIDVTTPNRRGRTRSGLRVHAGEHLDPDEIAEVDGIRCTSVSRTLIDLASVLGQPGLEAAVEATERCQLFDLRSLSVLIARHRGRRGMARLRTVLAAFDDEVLRTRSESEARLFHLCADRGLPLPLINRLADAGTRRFEVDCQWPEARLIVEVDSPYHDTTAAQSRDRARDGCLRHHGWTVIRCRWDDIVTTPEPLVAELRGRLYPASSGV